MRLSRCKLCPRNHNIVPPDGPIDAAIMLIGEGPGKDEDRELIPFCGRSGQEQDYTYFRMARINRADVFVTNAVLCRYERNNIDTRPPQALTDCCYRHHVLSELAIVNPKIVVLCGNAALSLAEEPMRLKLEHGIPRRGKLKYSNWEGWIVPMYHPAAGMHLTRNMTPLLKDWGRIGRWLRGNYKFNRDGAKPEFRLIESYREISSRKIPIENGWVSIDTESDAGIPYSLQFSGNDQSAYMIRANNRRAIQAFGALLNDCEGAIMHNALYDIADLERMKIKVGRFRDTMQELYHLGDMPQALKEAVYRAFGVKMISYEEVVIPYSLGVLRNWLEKSIEISNEFAQYEPHYKGKDCETCGKRHIKDSIKVKPHESKTRLKAILNKVIERVEKPDTCEYDPWLPPKTQKGKESARLVGRDWLGLYEEAIGKLPHPSIIHAPIDKQVIYGCSDAYWTRRLAVWLEGERDRIMREEWKIGD